MEKIFDRMGLYDIWTVLFPGVVFHIGTRSLYEFLMSLHNLLLDTPELLGKLGLFLKMNIIIPGNIYEFFIFLVVSYLYGLMLQELSSSLKHMIVYRKGDPRTLLLDETHGPLNSQELHRLMPLLKSLNNGEDFSESDSKKLKEESKYLFNQMNRTLQNMQKSRDYVKLNIIYNMCSTLSLVLAFFALMILTFEIQFLLNTDLSSFYFSLFLLSIIISMFLILHFKSSKYYQYWVRNIIFAYETLCSSNNN